MEKMSFGEALRSVFSKYATFTGRARRSEFWYFILLSVIAGAVIGNLSLLLGEDFGRILSSIWDLAILVPTLAVTWRRLHNIGKSGAWYFIILVPLVGAIIVLIWLSKDSQPGDNQYGPNPKGDYTIY